jgi:hypothetical protein
MFPQFSSASGGKRRTISPARPMKPIQLAVRSDSQQVHITLFVHDMCEAQMTNSVIVSFRSERQADTVQNCHRSGDADHMSARILEGFSLTNCRKNRSVTSFEEYVNAFILEQASGPEVSEYVHDLW